MPDLLEPEPIRCPEPGCRWTATGIPDGDASLHALIVAQHAVDAHVATEWGVTTDVGLVLDRLAILLESRVHQPCKARRLIRRAVYGGLWSVERIGDVPVEDRPRLRALAADVTRLVCPGGAHAKAVTVDEVRQLARPA